MKKGFTLLEVLIVVSIISVLVLVFLVSSNGYVTRADLQRQKTNSMVLESAIRQHKLEEGALPFGSKITKELSVETKKIIEQQLKNKGVSFDSVKDTFYVLDKKKMKVYIKGQMKSFDDYFSSDSAALEGMVFTYSTINSKKDGTYSGSYVLLEVDGEDGNEVKPPDPPPAIVCNTSDPSADSTIRLPSEGSGLNYDPYIVTTVGELQSMKLSPNSYFELANDIEACATKDWNAGKGFEPIPIFRGNFKDLGFSINNLTIDRPQEDNIGLFRELQLPSTQYVSVKMKSPVVKGRDNVGIVSGKSNEDLYSSHVHITNGYVEGVMNVGGIIGAPGNESTFALSEFEGTVKGKENVGGLIGIGTEMRISEVFFRGEVTGEKGVGGIIGNINNDFNWLTSSYVDGQIIGNTNTQVFFGITNPSSSNTFAKNLFFNKDKTTVSTSVGKGKTTAEMKLQETYTGFDFDTEWGIDPNINNGFPYLK